MERTILIVRDFTVRLDFPLSRTRKIIPDDNDMIIMISSRTMTTLKIKAALMTFRYISKNLNITVYPLSILNALTSAVFNIRVV